MRNYNDLTFISNLDTEDLVDFIKKAIKDERVAIRERQEELLLHRWGYELMFMENPISFEEYKDMAFGAEKRPSSNGSSYSNEELIDKIERMRRIDQGL